MSKEAAAATNPPRRSGLRVKLAKAGVLVASLMLAIGVGEVVARVAYPRKRSVSWYHYDARYGFRHRENADAITYDWGDAEPWRFRTNSHGFRWPEWSNKPALGTPRVIVAGDSFTFGNALEEEQAYPRVAGATAGAGWEVINAGVSAWGPSSALAYLETEGSDIGASCLVYGIFEGNDVMDNVVYHLYEIKDGAFTKVPVTVPPPSRLATVRDFLRQVPLYDALLEHSQLFNMLRTAGMTSLLTHDDVAPKVDLYSHPSKETFAAALDLDDQTLDHLAALSRSRFGAFALVMIPMAGQLSKSATPFPASMADETHERVLGWAKKNAVPVLDMREVLPADPAEIAKYYFVKDFHLNAEGNRVLGKALGERLPAMCAKQALAAP